MKTEKIEGLTADELEKYMKEHKREFKEIFKANTLRRKARSFEIPAIQHEVNGNTIKVSSGQNKNTRWTFFVHEVKQSILVGSSKNITKEIVRKRDYNKILSF